MRNIFTPLLVLAALPALAQTQALSGRVTGSDGSAVPGVTILERGTTNGVTSDADGIFRLAVQPQATLVISSVGFTTQTVAVNGRSSLNLTLLASATDLNEAVVVGYGTQTKADLTHSPVLLKAFQSLLPFLLQNSPFLC